MIFHLASHLAPRGFGSSFLKATTLPTYVHESTSPYTVHTIATRPRRSHRTAWPWNYFSPSDQVVKLASPCSESTSGPGKHSMLLPSSSSYFSFSFSFFRRVGKFNEGWHRIRTMWIRGSTLSIRSNDPLPRYLATWDTTSRSVRSMAFSMTMVHRFQWFHARPLW